VVDWDGLENRSRCKPTVGSNPTPSAALRFVVVALAERTRGAVVRNIRPGGGLPTALTREWSERTQSSRKKKCRSATSHYVV
jgi:hypothetical protein